MLLDQTRCMTTQSQTSTWIHRSPFHRSGTSLADVFTTIRPRRRNRSELARRISSYPATRGVAPLTHERH